jgi:hypothetical protein
MRSHLPLKILTMFKCQINVNLSIAAPYLVLLRCISPITQAPFKYMAWRWCCWVGRGRGGRGNGDGVWQNALLTLIVSFCLLHYLRLRLVLWSLFISIPPGPHLVNPLIHTKEDASRKPVASILINSNTIQIYWPRESCCPDFKTNNISFFHFDVMILRLSHISFFHFAS